MFNLLKSTKPLIIIGLAILFTGCASTSNNPQDPLEGFNRNSFAVNRAIDNAVIKPVAKGYVAVVPGPIRTSVSNVSSNAAEPVNAVNNLLQGKLSRGASDIGRLAVNTVFGIFGLWDVATPMGLTRSNEDFGQTLGVWGVGPGPYLVLPFIGPSTLRDAVGRWPDGQLGWSKAIGHVPTRNSLLAMDLVNIRATFLEGSALLDSAALDPYSFTRDSFLQRRRSLVYDGNPPKLKEE